MLDYKMYGAPIRAQATIANDMHPLLPVVTTATLNNDTSTNTRDLSQSISAIANFHNQQAADITTTSITSNNCTKQFSLHRADMANLNQNQQQHQQQQQQQQQQLLHQQEQKNLSANRNYVNQLLANGQQPQFPHCAQNQNLMPNAGNNSNNNNNISNNVGQTTIGQASNTLNDSTLSFAFDEIGAIINSKDFEELLAEAKNTTPSQQNFQFQTSYIISQQQQQVQEPDVVAASNAAGVYQVGDARQSISATTSRPQSQNNSDNDRQYMTFGEAHNRPKNSEYYQSRLQRDNSSAIANDNRRRMPSTSAGKDVIVYDNNQTFVSQNLILNNTLAQQIQQQQQQRLMQDQQSELRRQNQAQYSHTPSPDGDDIANQQQQQQQQLQQQQGQSSKQTHKSLTYDRQQTDLFPLMAPIDACKPYVEIVEHPAKCALRFRYKCEGRSAGSLPGVNSTADHKTYPSIRIANHYGRSVVVISCVTKDAPYKAHPHNIVGKEGCKKGVCTIVHNNDPNTVRSFSIGIQCVKRKDVEESLALRKSIKVDPFNNGFDHKSCPSNIDLNVVRLCFQVFIEGSTPNKCDVPLVPVVSDPIHDKKAMSELVITKLSHCSAPATGGREIILLCDRISKDDIKVRFYEEKDDKVIWETYTDIAPTDVHKQVAICFKTPKYYNENITHPVMARIQLKRVSDNQFSEPRLFQFLPCESDEDIISRKRQKIEWVNMML